MILLLKRVLLKYAQNSHFVFMKLLTFHKTIYLQYNDLSNEALTKKIMQTTRMS